MNPGELPTTGDKNEAGKDTYNVETSYQNAIKMNSYCSTVIIFVSKDKLVNDREATSTVAGEVCKSCKEDESKKMRDLV